MTNPNEVEELKSCPFCGFKMRLCVNIKYNFVTYEHPEESPKDCILLEHIIFSDIKSINNWNTRVSHPPSKEPINLPIDPMEVKEFSDGSDKEECRHQWSIPFGFQEQSSKNCIKCGIKYEISGYSIEMPYKLEFEDDKSIYRYIKYDDDSEIQTCLWQGNYDKFLGNNSLSPLVALDEKAMHDLWFQKNNTMPPEFAYFIKLFCSKFGQQPCRVPTVEQITELFWKEERKIGMGKLAYETIAILVLQLLTKEKS